MPPPAENKLPGWHPGEVPAPMQAVGAAATTQSGKANHLRIGERFLAHADNAAWGKVWTDVPEAEICTATLKPPKSIAPPHRGRVRWSSRIVHAWGVGVTFTRG